jgi:CpcD/allophycocyanin linker domain
MATMTVTSQSTDTTAYGSRLATLEVAGVSARNGHQTMLVPLNRLSQTMQQIHRQGGTIISVNMGNSAPAMSRPSVMDEAPVVVPADHPQDSEQELAMEEPKVVQQSNSKKKKR